MQQTLNFAEPLVMRIAHLQDRRLKSMKYMLIENPKPFNMEKYVVWSPIDPLHNGKVEQVFYDYIVVIVKKLLTQCDRIWWWKVI